MNQAQVVESLREEAKKNDVARAVFITFALRGRARNVITVHSLSQKMRKGGFTHDRAAYIEVLKFLASLGFGTLDTDPRGRVRSLKNIKTTLQSIGKAACGEVGELKDFSPRNKYGSLPAQMPTAVPPVPTIVNKPDILKKTKKLHNKNIALLLSINGKEVRVMIPDNLDTEELGEVIGLLKRH